MLNTTPLRCLLVAAVALAAPACTDDASSDDNTADAVTPDTTPPPIEGHQTVRSPLTRELAPDATEAELQALADGNQALTVDLYLATSSPSENYMVSTLSIRSAFAMVYAGARGDTAAEMAEVLNLDPDAERFHTAYNALDLTLASRNLPADVENELDPVELYMANAFWGQAGTPWSESYLDTLAVNYGAGVESVDFDADADGVRRIINTWVEDRTRDRIQDLLPDGSITSDTAAVLTNAVYFRAPWGAPFEEYATQSVDFTLLDGSTVEVDMMNQLEAHRYYDGDTVDAVELAFRGESLSMVVLVPDSGAFESATDTLSVELLREVTAGLQGGLVDVALPKFTFESSFTLSDALKDLGMTTAFSSAADLSGMLPGGGLYIDEAYHKTFIAVDESGAEAAAATAVVVGETSVPVVDFTLRADRPFFFGIRDRELDVWLFFGHVVDPR